VSAEAASGAMEGASERRPHDIPLNSENAAMPETAVEVKREPQQKVQAKKPAPAAAPPASLENLWRTGLDNWNAFRSEMDRMFEQFWRGNFALPAWRQAFEPERLLRLAPYFGFSTPAVDFAEDDKAFHLEAELPGMTDKDIEVKVSGDMLTIKGEKREEKQEKGKHFHFSERRYGSFLRSFTLPDTVDRDKVEASFKDGVLTVILPKTAEAVKQQKKIEVKAG
jgi:HSP20 family protein